MNKFIFLIIFSSSIACNRTIISYPANSFVYKCLKTKKPPVIDGQIDESVWSNANWIEDFSTLDAKEKAIYQTKTAMLWDDENLYLVASLEDPSILSTMTERDDVLYKDDVFELFFDPLADGKDYYELEINAFGTLWDLKVSQAYKKGGKGNNDWDIPSHKAAVHLNENRQNWTLEMAIPWSSFSEGVPQRNQYYKANFMRVDWQKNGKAKFWTWAPTGKANDVHVPKEWGYVEFVR